MVTRREFLGITAGAGTALAFTPELLRALQPSRAELIQRAIPSSGEMLPVVSFSPRDPDSARVEAVLEAFVDNGGRVVDLLHSEPSEGQAALTAARELGVRNEIFWTAPLQVTIPVLPGYAGPPLVPDREAVEAAMEEKLATLGAPVIDLVMVSAAADLPTHLAVLREMKREGRVRYIGVHDLLFPPNAPAPAPATARLEQIMQSEELDFVGTDYSVGDRRLEERVLPLAQERRIGVMAYFPFDRGRGLGRVGDTPLPEWAAEFDATTWAQFFLKYVVSHPAVTVVRTGTTRPEHILDNIGGGSGRLPDEATRARMAQLVDGLPPTPAAAPPPPPASPPAPPVALSAAILDRYVGQYLYAASGQVVTFRRDADRLLMKISGSFPEVPLVARSETRFAVPLPDVTLEFQLGGGERVTGALWEMGPYRIPLERR